MTTIDQRADCQKNEVTNFESRQGNTKSYFNGDYSSERPINGGRFTHAQIALPQKTSNESIGPFDNCSII